MRNRLKCTLQNVIIVFEKYKLLFITFSKLHKERRDGVGKHPKLSELDSLFDNRSEIRLTDRQYEEKTGVALPQRKDYLMYKSALAEWICSFE